MRLVAIGDVGVVDDMMHIGDEAMFEALRDELTARGADIVALSSAPHETAARYGIRSIARIGFTGLDRSASEARLAAVLAAAEGGAPLAAGDPAAAVISAVASADGVVVAGGGNLASTWPLHVYERAALAGIAERLGRAFVITGQTFGPRLEGRDRELVGGMLRSAALVGVRESASRALAAELGVEARVGVDDASFLAWDAPSPPAGATGGVLVSLSLSLGDAPRAETVRAIARLVDAAADAEGGRVLFHAHFGPEHGGIRRGDEVLHDEVRAEMRTPSLVIPTGGSGGAAALARGAGLLITGRYHPAVFAAPAGVPVLGLVTDEYTAVKQRGALEHWGQGTVVPITRAEREGLSLVGSLRARRPHIQAVASERRPLHRRDASSWWDLVADRLSSAGVA
ncbi:polysaccharide pyruvyl transferase family protein [Micromonospora sp. DT81.3]|uniref:polysaccharide pyruvyl transferase family protein n=1 Tax=Micromonospora sp. DT81.3 TaxID=3416523 RepID=UPI003CF9E9D5